MTQTATLDLIGLPKNRYSHSMGEDFRTCACKYARGYLQELKGRLNSALVWGNIVHAGLAWAGSRQIEGKARPSAEQIAEYIGDEVAQFEISKAMHEHHRGIEFKSDDTPEKMKADAMAAVKVYEAALGHKLQPLEIEKFFRLELENYDFTITGKLDHYDRSGAVLDFKTGGRKLPVSAAATSQQLPLYQAAQQAEGKAVTSLDLHGIVRQKSGIQIQPLRVEPATEEQLGRLLDNIATMVLAMRAGVFPRADDWETCTDFCGHLEECHPEWYALKEEIKIRKQQEKSVKNGK